MFSGHNAPPPPDVGQKGGTRLAEAERLLREQSVLMGRLVLLINPIVPETR